MVTRVRIEARGASAAEVEAVLHAAAAAFAEELGEDTAHGEQFIEREMAEPAGYTAFSGRLILHPNVASDAPQVEALRRRGVDVTCPRWTTTEALAEGGVPTV